MTARPLSFDDGHDGLADLAAQHHVEGRRPAFRRELWQADKAADKLTFVHPDFWPRYAAPDPLPTIVCVSRDPIDTPATADPYPPFEDDGK